MDSCQTSEFCRLVCFRLYVAAFVLLIAPDVNIHLFKRKDLPGSLHVCHARPRPPVRLLRLVVWAAGSHEARERAVLREAFSLLGNTEVLTFRHLTKYSYPMRTFMAITKALADPNRVRLLLALQGGELCVCQISELFGLASSTMSKHLSILYSAGLIESRKTERWVFYRLPGREAPVAVREAIDWVQKSLEDAPQAATDRKKLKQLLKLQPTTLCQRQNRK